jgi:hypothetical protein
MNNVTALFIAALAVAVGGYLYWDGTGAGGPSVSEPDVGGAGGAGEAPLVPQEGAPEAESSEGG